MMEERDKFGLPWSSSVDSLLPETNKNCACSVCRSHSYALGVWFWHG